MISWRCEPWDSEILGVPVARVLDLCDPCTVTEQCIKHGVRYLFAKIPWSNTRAIQSFQDDGFQAICSEIEMRLSHTPTILPSSPSSPLSFRMATLPDEEELREIALTSFSYSRFHCDPTIPVKTADSSRADWISNVLHGRRGMPCEIHLLTTKECLVGFVVCAVQEREGIIDLIAVRPDLRGHGHGKALCLRGAGRLGQHCSHIRAIVNSANIPALRTYLSAGFRPTVSQLVTRKWLEC